MSVSLASNNLHKLINGDEQNNCASEMIARGNGFHIHKNLTITGTGSISVNVLQVTGTVLISDQWALITRVGTLTNCTDLYGALYDGTNTVDLTKTPGAVLSGAPVGSFFTKDYVATEILSVNLADECRLLETENSKKSGRAFTVTQKNGADTYIQLILTTTDNPIDFDVTIHFEYYPVNGSTLTFL